MTVLGNDWGNGQLWQRATGATGVPPVAYPHSHRTIADNGREKNRLRGPYMLGCSDARMELTPKAFPNASFSACLLSYPPKKYGIRPVGRVAPRPPEMEFTHLFPAAKGLAALPIVDG